jgi:hypothetical protein
MIATMSVAELVESVKPQKITDLTSRSQRLMLRAANCTPPYVCFFADGDLVSMHTLACASHEVLRTLVKAKGGGSQLKDSEHIKPDQRKVFGELLNRPSNFFKHAGRDPDDVLTIYHKFCHVWLLDCCIMYQQMTGKYSRECAVFLRQLRGPIPRPSRAGILPYHNRHSCLAMGCRPSYSLQANPLHLPRRSGREQPG